MRTPRRHRRQNLCRLTTLAMLFLSFGAPVSVLAANQDATLYFRPHCEEGEQTGETMLGPVPDVEGLVSTGEGGCTEFEVEDPQTLRTKPLEQGELLDFDIVVRNPSKQAINHVRSWVAFDPNVFEGVMIIVHPNFPLVTPGEADFDRTNGYLMLELSNDAEGANQKSDVAVAQIQLRAKITPAAGTFISFYDVQPGGHAVVTTKENGNDEYILGDEPGGLHVVFAETAAPPAPEAPSGLPEEPPPPPGPPEGAPPPPGPNTDQGPPEGVPPPGPPSGEDGPDALAKVWDGGRCTEDAQCWSESCVEGTCAAADGPEEEAGTLTEESTGSGGNLPPPGGDRTTFSLLQVRNVRVTTEGSSVFLAWDALNSTALKAYNIYYGTTSGRYIQRKTIEGSMHSIILRAMPVGTTYYLAVRAVSKTDEESAFSQEAAVEVGNPKTSTSPLVENQTIEVAPTNPIAGQLTGRGEETPVPGETGLSSSIAILFLLCAVAGTALASRRQLIVTPAPQQHE